MSVRVRIPTQLRQLVDGQQEVSFDAANVRDLLKAIGQSHPALVERIIDESGEIRRFINVFVGDEDVRFLDGLDTQIPDAALVSILPAVAGG
ncbi:MAG: MoaD/ThiS family protein [Actinomycetota bacterium]|nr:MoaD/ThiS family protein [Actinomycetota bacterium]